MVLVVLERADEQQHLFLDSFFLLTNATRAEASAEALLERYRQRGTTEKDLGAWQAALHLRLSSTPRPKSHYREQPIRTPIRQPDSFAVNEARLLLSLLAANLLQAACRLLARTEQQRRSREHLRQVLLKASARVLLHSRSILVVIDRARAALWTTLWQELDRLYPIRGSPRSQALPTPAW